MKRTGKRLLGDIFVPAKCPMTPKGVAFVMKRTSKRLLGHFFVPTKCPRTLIGVRVVMNATPLGK